jgi:glycosyltransferase involved in cell wall biosynthesis
LIRKVSEILSNGNICIGDFIAKWYKTKPTMISYGAVDINENPQHSRESSAVFFGRLDEQTGILMYRDALLKIRKVYPHFSMVTVGEGKYEKNIASVKGISVIPFTPDIEPYLKKYRFVFVSRYLSIMEALAQKRLVFAVYDNPVKEDYLRMSPFSKYIYIAGSSSELAAQVISYIEDQEIGDRKIKDGYAFVSNKSWEKLVNDYLFLWKNAKRNL